MTVHCTKKFPWWGLRTCPFSRIIVVGSFLGLINTSAMGSWLSLEYKACISSCGVGLIFNQKEVGYPPSLLSLLDPWTYLSRLVTLIVYGVYKVYQPPCLCSNWPSLNYGWWSLQRAPKIPSPPGEAGIWLPRVLPLLCRRSILSVCLLYMCFLTPNKSLYLMILSFAVVEIFPPCYLSHLRLSCLFIL